MAESASLAPRSIKLEAPWHARLFPNNEWVLIVTLGTFSLFRGIAEGLTRGVENYSGFSRGFLFLGQGYVGGVLPTQLFILIAAIAGFAWWLHRTAFGRSLYAIGYSAEGARHAGIPVG